MQNKYNHQCQTIKKTTFIKSGLCGHIAKSHNFQKLIGFIKPFIALLKIENKIHYNSDFFN